MASYVAVPLAFSFILFPLANISTPTNSFQRRVIHVGGFESY